MKFKLIHVIVSATLLLFLIYIFLNKYRYYGLIVENYQSYDDCVNQGYPLEFCLEVPVQSYIGPDIYNNDANANANVNANANANANTKKQSNNCSA